MNKYVNPFTWEIVFIAFVGAIIIWVAVGE